jgi:glycosyltransferase involved in cell wall biosynthesis
MFVPQGRSGDNPELDMTIHLYTVCWNERRLLPYFLRHYERICNAIIIYDNESDDGSTDLIAAHSLCELRHLDTNGELHEENLLRVKGHEWKASRGRADWVICCDIDELLYHPRLLAFLDECRDADVTIPIPSGYQMVSDMFPVCDGQIYGEVRSGFPANNYDKRIVFNPDAIREINYSPGCHSAAPEGAIIERADPALKLLHFKFLGLDYLSERYAELDRRLSRSNRERGFGAQYSSDAAKLHTDFANYCSWAKTLDLNSGRT